MAILRRDIKAYHDLAEKVFGDDYRVEKLFSDKDGKRGNDIYGKKSETPVAYTSADDKLDEIVVGVLDPKVAGLAEKLASEYDSLFKGSIIKLITGLDVNY